MMNTPKSFRRHIAITGRTNAGKSSLFNALLGQDAAIISPERGTTTDPVIKSMEMIPYGPVALVDTAGTGDDSVLGDIRLKKTNKVLERCDLNLFVQDAAGPSPDPEGELPVVRVFTKCDLLDAAGTKALMEHYPDAVFFYPNDEASLTKLKSRLIKELEKLDEDRRETMIGDLLPSGSRVILVIPIDSEAPKGRLILPQVQLLRDCLDHGIRAMAVRETELPNALSDFTPDLVVTDSQAFKLVDELVPADIPLTSFSMLLARQKGDFRQMLEGVSGIGKLADGDTVLMLEGCTHNTSHEDIGRVKIPKLLREKTGKELQFTYYTGYDFPEHPARYQLAIQCGNCMISAAAVKNHLRRLGERKVPVTNYGMVLAYLNGILDRASRIFKQPALS